MTIIRSRTVLAKSEGVAVANPSVEAARREWEERLLAAREEGHAQGMADAQALVAEAQATEAAAAERIAASEAACEARVANERASIVEQIGHCLASLQQALADDAARQRAWIEEAEHTAVELALALAGRILHHSVQHDPAWMRDLLTAAIADAPDRQGICVRVHPEDKARLEAVAGAVAQSAGVLGGLELIGDAACTRGACLVESAGTIVDAGVGGSWERLCAALREQAPPGQHQLEFPVTDQSAVAAIDTAAARASEVPPARLEEAVDALTSAGDAEPAAEAETEATPGSADATEVDDAP